ncbi:MAG: hypothetical protein J6U06_06350 [Spirochaetaceae bacterium]|nr:hypothetical protein [Spirochaetaceae bacterium]
MKIIPLITALVLISASAFIFASGSIETEAAQEAEAGSSTTAESVEQKETEKTAEQPKKAKPSKSKTILAAFNKTVEERNYTEGLEIWQNAKDYINNEEETDKEDISETFTFIESTINDYLNDVEFEKVSAPPATTKGKSFKSAFAVKLVSKTGMVNPLNLKYTVTYPIIDEDGKKTTATKIVEPSEDGTIEFTSPTYPGAISSSVTFKVDLPENVYTDFANAPSIDLPFLVATNMKASGGSIAIVDFTKAGKPITSNSETSSAVLTELIKKGFTRIGNCDFVNEVVSKNDAAVQRSASELFGKSVTYLIYGTVKYDTVEKVDAGIHVILRAELKVRHILQNKELMATTIVSEATEKSEWAAINAARKKLAYTASNQILYGM